MKKRAYIFDLDATVICSKHRQLTRPDGSLDLEHWREHCTPEKIAADSLLPLADTMRAAWYTGALVIVCTSRVMTSADFEFLEKNRLFYHFAAYRMSDQDTRRDGPFKRDKLTHILKRFDLPPNRVAFYEDNEHCLQVARDLGICVIDSKIANREMIAA